VSTTKVCYFQHFSKTLVKAKDESVNIF